MKVSTIYFGGGTPSLLSLDHFQQILNVVSKNIPIEENAEISLEANPETVTREYIYGLRQLGFNRISFGMQSASPNDLRVLDRAHRFESIVDAVKWSEQAEFQHINLDLIFGIPNQSLESWRHTLTLALNFPVDHFSIYSLIVENGTRLKRWIDKGLLPEPDDDLAASMYDETMDFLEQANYQQYEISNWSKDDQSQCQHNLQYWRFLPYLGFGAGAHGYYQNTRTENIGSVTGYIQAVNKARFTEFPSGPALLEATRLSEWEKIQENLMVSLRMTREGVNLGEFQNRYHLQPQDLFAEQMDRLLGWNLIEFVDNGQILRLTRRGRMFGNRVFMEFVGNKIPKGYEFLDR